MVIVHGVMDRAVGWKRVIRHLESVEVLAFDRRGYHRNVGHDWGANRLEADVSDVHDVAGLASSRPTIVVGHSQGALIAWHAARPGSVRGRFDGLILWEPPMPWEDWYQGSWGSASLEREPGEAAEFFLRGVLGDRLWNRFDSNARDERRREGRALLSDLAASRSPSGRPLTEALPLAVLIGTGGRSAVHNQVAAATAHDMIPGSTVVTIDDTGHAVQLEAPSSLAALVESFAAELGRR